MEYGVGVGGGRCIGSQGSEGHRISLPNKGKDQRMHSAYIWEHPKGTGGNAETGHSIGWLCAGNHQDSQDAPLRGLWRGLRGGHLTPTNAQVVADTTEEPRNPL